MLSNSIMMKFFGLALINNVIAQDMVGGTRDANNCLIGAGYTWCESSNECIRSWITPCSDNFNGCDDCLRKQQKGQNIACPEDCSYIAVDPVPVPTPERVNPSCDSMPCQNGGICQVIGSSSYTCLCQTGFMGVDCQTSTTSPWSAPSPNPRSPCSDVMCMMYCPTGNQVDSNGCQLCECNELPVAVDPLTVDQPVNDCPLIQPSCQGHMYVCPKLTEITRCNQGGIKGYTTYQLSLVVQPNMNVKNIYAMYGDSNNMNNMHIPEAYQSPVNKGQNIGGVSEYMVSIFPETNYDSWLTIGITNGDPTNLISAVGIDFNSWSESNAMDIDNGAVFIMDPSSTDLSEQGTEIIIAQLTVPTQSTSTAVINVQGKTENYNNDIDTKSWTENNIHFPLIPPQNIDPNTIPSTCVSWFDGCNTCRVSNGQLGGCTRMMCFREDEPRCLQYATSGH